jgi:hypothetical protein
VQERRAVALLTTTSPTRPREENGGIAALRIQPIVPDAVANLVSTADAIVAILTRRMDLSLINVLSRHHVVSEGSGQRKRRSLTHRSLSWP